MLDLNVSSKIGNAVGSFPHQGESRTCGAKRQPPPQSVSLPQLTTPPHPAGYFGVTPVVLDGTVHTRLAAGAEPLMVRNVTMLVRCYEVRESGPFRSSRENILWERRQDLFCPPDGKDAVSIPTEWERPFSLTIPPEAAEHARGTKSMREWRVKWRLEAVVNHKPIQYVGDRVAKAFVLDLHNHRTPQTPPPSTAAGATIGAGHTSTQLFINPPHGPFGPGDIIPISLSARPEDYGSSIRKVQVILDRRLEMLDDKMSPPHASSSSSRRPSPTLDDGQGNKSKRMSSIFLRGSSPRSASRLADDNNERVNVTRIAEAPCDISSAGDSGAIWSVGSIQLPRRGNRWDTGETERTEFAAVSFDLRIKLTLKTKRGTSELVSAPVPVVIVGATTSERATAQNAAANSAYETSRSMVKAKRSRNRHSVYQQHDVVHFSSGSTLKGGSSRKSLTPSPPSRSTINLGIISPPPPPPVVVAPRRIPSAEDLDSYADCERESSLESTPSSHRVTLPPLQPYYPTCATPAPSTGADSSSSSAVLSPDAPTDEYEHVYQIRQQSGRRISATTSDDEEDFQPSRSRPKLHATPAELYPVPGMPFGLPFHDPASPSHPAPAHMPIPPPVRTQPLPSLDALGFGLPHVPEEHRPLRRPRTAPTSFGVYTAAAKPTSFPSGGPPPVQRPSTSSGPGSRSSSFAFALPPLPEQRVSEPRLR